MHSVDIPYLKRENIDLYLEKLAEAIERKGFDKKTIYIMGGSCVALLCDESRSTVDIDVAVKENKGLKECCDYVAKTENIPLDWLNTDIMYSNSFSVRLYNKALFYKNFNGYLDTYVIPEIDLFCMKLVAFRQKDVRDIRIIAKVLNNKCISQKDILEEFSYLYGNLDKLSKQAMLYLKYAIKKKR